MPFAQKTAMTITRSIWCRVLMQHGEVATDAMANHARRAHLRVDGRRCVPRGTAVAQPPTGDRWSRALGKRPSFDPHFAFETEIRDPLEYAAASNDPVHLTTSDHRLPGSGDVELRHVSGDDTVFHLLELERE